MRTIKEIYKIGRGPSSSHTMGPSKAAAIFLSENPNADKIRVTLYGSLAKTGKGHHTDEAIIKTLKDVSTEVIFNVQNEDIPHENTLDFEAIKDGVVVNSMRVMSIGGGDIKIEGREYRESPDIYPHSTFTEISKYCKERNMRLSDYVFSVEPSDTREYLYTVWNTMKNAISEGLSKTGILEGGLGVERKAQLIFNQRHIDESSITRENRIVCAYAFAVGEQNAAGEIIVTAPTCGASASLPAALCYMQEKKGFSDEEIVRALAVAGIIGNIVKTNASISGAQCGCQAEIGTACSMTAAALCELFEMGIGQIEYAAEVAMEHHLGLTCDPVRGLVQIPCIERGAVAAMRAINALSLANFLSNVHKISFDLVVETMYETGKDMSQRYTETSEGVLAKLFK